MTNHGCGNLRRIGHGSQSHLSSIAARCMPCLSWAGRSSRPRRGSERHGCIDPANQTPVTTGPATAPYPALRLPTPTGVQRLKPAGESPQTKGVVAVGRPARPAEALGTASSTRRLIRLVFAATIGLALVVLAAPAALAQPANDDFANATPIGSLPFADMVDHTAATTQPSEPSPSCVGLQNTVWYAFTPTTTQSVSARTDQGGVGLGAYTGSSLADLTQLGCSQFPPTEPVTFRAEANTTYYFQVGAWCCEGFGQVTFNLDVAANPVADFVFSPGDPSVFDAVQFQDSSSDPAGAGIAAGVALWRRGHRDRLLPNPSVRPGRGLHRRGHRDDR
jgi:hypothetical protein